MAFALPVFKMDKLGMLIPTASESSVNFIFLRASITSKFTMIAMVASPIGGAKRLVRDLRAFRGCDQ